MILWVVLGCGPQVGSDQAQAGSGDTSGTSTADTRGDIAGTSTDEGGIDEAGEPESPQTWCIHWREPLHVQDGAVSVAIANLDGDLPELWTISVDPQGSSLYRAQRLEGDTLVTIDTFARPGSFYAFGDIDGDGIDDALVVVSERAQMGWLRGNSSGRLEETVLPLDLPLLGPSTSVADFNGDGLVDVLRQPGGSVSLEIFVGTGDGTFTLAGTLETSAYSSKLETHPIGPRQTILVAWESCIGFCEERSRLMVLEFDPDGTASWVVLPLALEGLQYIDARDHDGDGMPDLLLERIDDGVRGIAWYDSPEYVGTVHVEPSLVHLVGDIDLDGTNDVLEIVSTDAPSIRFGQAGEGLGMSYPLLHHPYGKSVEADLDGDGVLDFVLQTFDTVDVWTVMPCEA